MNLLKEAKNLDIYKQLLDVLGDYTDKFPATGVDKILDDLIVTGVKVIPKDKKAQEILQYILKGSNSPEVVQKLLNTRFSNLPISIRPVYKNKNKRETAFWSVDGEVYDKVVSLVNIKGKQTKNNWSNPEGVAATLINF